MPWRRGNQLSPPLADTPERFRDFDRTIVSFPNKARDCASTWIHGIRVAVSRKRRRSRTVSQKKTRSSIEMQPSMFNLRVPLPARDEVFLMNTLTDAQLVVSTDVADVLDRCVANTNPVGGFRPDEWDAFKVLADNGFLVANRAADRRNLDAYLDEVKRDTSELNVTVLTT